MKNILLFIALCAAALAQTIPPGVGVYNLSGGSGGGGNGTITAGTTNRIPKYTAATTIGNSLLSDDATTLTYTGTGGFALTSSATAVLTITGATSGSFIFTGVDAMGQALTFKAAAQTVGAATLTVPDQVGVNRNVVSDTGTQTLTNKRITARVGSTTSSATPTINTDSFDIYKLTAQAADITSMTTNLTGTPVDGDQFQVIITGTAARAITWGASFVAGPQALPTTTTTTKTLYVYFQFDSVVTHWVCMYAGSLP